MDVKIRKEPGCAKLKSLIYTGKSRLNSVIIYFELLLVYLI